MEKRRVLVTGIGGNVGQGILRNIRNCFPDIYLVGIDVSAFTAGNHLCHKVFKVPYSFEKNYTSVVNEIVKNERIELIIPSTDYEVYYLSNDRNSIGATILASDSNVSKIFLDKFLTYKYLSENNIAFAKSWLPIDYDFSENEIIAKPREGRGSRGIIINPENPSDLPENYLIQRLYKGIEITTAVYVNKQSKLHGVFTMERSLTNGTTTECRTIFHYDSEMSNMAQKMIDLGGLKGSFNIQSIVTESNEIVPFEINCRISGTNSIRHNLGFQDVKYAIQEYLFNESPDNPCPTEGVATRILMDVVYPGTNNFDNLKAEGSNFLIY